MKNCFLYLALLLLMPLGLRAQSAPPAKGYKLQRVRHLRPVAQPPGGLVPYQGYYDWGLSDTLGRVYVRPIFQNEPKATAGPFWVAEWREVGENDMRSERWEERHGDSEIWLNARGHYLVIPSDYAAYRQPDGSLVAKPYRRHLTEPLYRYEVLPYRQDKEAQVPSPWRYWRNHRRGWIYYLGAGLYAVRGPSEWRYFRRERWRRHRYRHSTAIMVRGAPLTGPAQALFDSASRRITPYQYERLGRIHNGRIRYALYKTPFIEGFLDRRGYQVLGPYRTAANFSHGRAVVSLEGTGKELLYALIDTTGTFILAPQPGRLDGPDERGFVRRSIPRAAERQVYQYLSLDGKPAFPGRYFGWGEQFTGDSAAVPDTLNQPGVLYANGTWLPRPTTLEQQYVKPARGMVVPADSSRVVLVNPSGHRVTAATYAKGQALAGGWFVAYDSASSPAILITPVGNRYPLPPGYAPDLLYHGPDNYNHAPFDNGLLKVRWGKPHQEGWEPKREAYMTRSGRILVGDPDPK